MTGTGRGCGGAAVSWFVMLVLASASATAEATNSDDAPERPAQPTTKLIALKYRDSLSVREVLNILPANITADVQTNRLLVLGNAEEIRQVEELVRELDVPIERTSARPEPELKVYRLRHRAPDELMHCLTPMLSERGKISADPGSRTLLVKDEPAVHTDLAMIIRELDVNLAAVAPASLDDAVRPTQPINPVGDLRHFNARAAESTASLDPNSATRAAAEPSVKLHLKICEINRTVFAGLPADDPAVALSPLVPELARGGKLCSVAEPFDHAAWLRTMAERGALKIVGEPTLIVASGHSASFFKQIGEYAAPLVIEDDTDMDAVTQVAGLGVDLKFLPTVAGPDRVRLQAASAFDAKPDGGDADSAAQGPPFVSVDVRAGQLFALSGTVTERADAPPATGVGKVPLLGQLLRGKRQTPKRTELLILVIPEVVPPRDPTDIALEPRGERRE